MQASEPPPRSAGQVVLSASANVFGAVALWGTMWNVLFKWVFGRAIKPCATSFDTPLDENGLPDFGSTTSSTSCPPLPEVPWNLIIASVVILLLLAIVWWLLWGRQMLDLSSPDSTAGEMFEGQGDLPDDAGEALVEDPGPVGVTARRSPTATSAPRPTDLAAKVPAHGARSPAQSGPALGSFLGDPKFAGLMSLVGLLVAIVQLFR